ncbi:MAG: ABC transporter permease [Gemmatimonas sp.]|jgi:peptide/nickel transport system permease protein|uniref:ABC transporter permease n=2 Tax=Gemmatimonas sp. TaxID=1962908 RepID=UPI00391EF0C6|nr:ABC transporter permease [Gemmatimonadota bacterium]
MTNKARAHSTLARGAALMALLITVAVAAPLLSPYPPNATLDLLALKSCAPSWAHPFGTDAYSRDVLSRVLHGARVSLAFSLASATLVLVIGTAYGALAAFSPPLLRTVLRRALDVAMSVPRLLVLLAVAGVAGPFDLAALVWLISATGWFATARMVTGELDALATREFALAARAQGVRASRLVLRHLAPHLAPLLAVAGTFGVANAIGLEAGLSFLGLGIQPPTASWGTILRDGAGVIRSQWWLTVFPGIAMILPVVACNAVGDALRDRFALTQFDRP